MPYFPPVCCAGYRAGNLLGGWNVDTFWHGGARLAYSFSETALVLFYFPLLVALGAGTTVSQSAKRICVFSGKVSYPLYMTHYAAIWIFDHYYTTTNPDAATLTSVVVTGTILLVGFAYLVTIAYDTPVRRYLAAKTT